MLARIPIAACYTAFCGCQPVWLCLRSAVTTDKALFMELPYARHPLVDDGKGGGESCQGNHCRFAGATHSAGITAIAWAWECCLQLHRLATPRHWCVC
jgi:hypothetical protein